MTHRTKNLVLATLVACIAFLLGRRVGSAPSALELEAAPSGPTFRSAAPISGAQRRKPAPPKKGKTEALVYESGGVGAAANGFIAVTGSYGVGTSVLYLMDTKTNQLAVYEARGGSVNSRRLYLVGARRVDLDLQLEGYNDQSEWSYDQLRQRFEKKGIKAKR